MTLNSYLTHSAPFTCIFYLFLQSTPISSYNVFFACALHTVTQYSTANYPTHLSVDPALTYLFFYHYA